ncbi:MAG TPA: protease modulator HflC [Acidobacteria bacterium]|jgi:membrane protease subunit HflC|nr:protease modulator HflC [Acidobacteriota bacterium]|tara:strand:- start:340 stop:1272 length:933 start_codon:yes stop_codon:yes gene_type:complete
MTNSTMTKVIIALGVLFVLSSATYQVHEVNQVIITQFGEPTGEPVTDPGLHFKIPFVQQTNYFEKRFLEWDGSPNQVPTKDKRFIWVDTYARWRIVDPLRFFQRLRDELGAQSRLDDILDGETRNAVARYDLIEIVRSTNRDPDTVQIESDEETAILDQIQMGRQEIAKEILERAAGRTEDLGIELLDLRLKRINYVAEVQQDVFARMIAERQRIAAEFRSEGQGESARISGERERDLAQIQSEAYRTAEELRGTADAEATSIYGEAYNRDPDFYAFTKSLETYEQTMDASTFFMLGTDSELLKYLEQPR